MGSLEMPLAATSGLVVEVAGSVGQGEVLQPSTRKISCPDLALFLYAMPKVSWSRFISTNRGTQFQLRPFNLAIAFKPPIRRYTAPPCRLLLPEFGHGPGPVVYSAALLQRQVPI